MSTVQEIERAVSRLSENDLKQFSDWFAEFEARKWDQEFDSDILNGKLDQLRTQAPERFKTNECSPL